MNSCRDLARTNRSMDASSVRQNVTICEIGPHGRGVHATTVINAPILTDARQLFSHEHVDDAAAAEDGLHDDAAGAVVGDFADDRGTAAQGM